MFEALSSGPKYFHRSSTPDRLVNEICRVRVMLSIRHPAISSYIPYMYERDIFAGYMRRIAISAPCLEPASGGRFIKLLQDTKYQMFILFMS